MTHLKKFMLGGILDIEKSIKWDEAETGNDNNILSYWSKIWLIFQNCSNRFLGDFFKETLLEIKYTERILNSSRRVNCALLRLGPKVSFQLLNTVNTKCCGICFYLNLGLICYYGFEKHSHFFFRKNFDSLKERKMGNQKKIGVVCSIYFTF